MSKEYLMKKISLVLMAALVLALVIGFVGCAKEPANNNNNNNNNNPSPTQTTVSIVGTWKYTGEESFPDTLVFYSSGTFKGFVEGTIAMSGSYVASNGSVTLSMEMEEEENINVAGSYTSTTLTLTYYGRLFTLNKQ